MQHAQTSRLTRNAADVLIGLTMIGGRRHAAGKLIDLVRLEPQDCVLDIGCGPGVAVRLAAAHGATAIGVDPSAGMLWLARRLSRGTKARLAFRHATAA